MGAPPASTVSNASTSPLVAAAKSLSFQFSLGLFGRRLSGEFKPALGPALDPLAGIPRGPPRLFLSGFDLGAIMGLAIIKSFLAAAIEVDGLAMIVESSGVNCGGCCSCINESSL